MYNGVMQRTQIYLDDGEISMLNAAAERTGASKSELIRRAIRSTFGDKPVVSRREALQSSAGAWQGRSFTGAQYVDAIRGDLNERLARLGSR